MNLSSPLTVLYNRRSNLVQSERGNQRDSLWLAHEDLAMHSNCSNAVGF